MENVFNQWEMVNASIHKYRRLQSALETIIDQLLGEEEKALDMDYIIETATGFAKAVDFQSAWTDKWNFDDWASTYDETVYSDNSTRGVFDKYEIVLDKVDMLQPSSRALFMLTVYIPENPPDPGTYILSLEGSSDKVSTSERVIFNILEEKPPKPTIDVKLHRQIENLRDNINKIWDETEKGNDRA